MTETAPVSPTPARRRRTLSAAARLAERAREARVLELLAEGVSIRRIADAEGVTARRMRIVVEAILARREAEPASGFVQLQVRRLGQALDHAIEAMEVGNIQAIDRVIRIVRELERYRSARGASNAENGARREALDPLNP